MKKQLWLFRLALGSAVLLIIANEIEISRRSIPDESITEWAFCGEQDGKEFKPSDWFFAQRAYPAGEVNLDAYRAAVNEAIALRNSASPSPTGQTWIMEGPTNIGGRITDIAVDPLNRETIYAGAASGGVLKSLDGGLSWNPLFDLQPSLSIGALAVDPTDSDILYVGTGEANAGGGSVTYGGFGVFKTTDGGSTWENIGLDETRYIGRVLVDPRNPDRIFVAALGTLFSTNSDRGVYRTTDAGTTWEQILFVSDSTGAVDIIQDQFDTDILYAAMWERIRRPDRRSYGGATSGVYRTTDGGDTWVLLSGGLPSDADVGRIGLALSAADPSIVNAVFADSVGYFKGLYRSTDSGDTWNRVNDGALASGYFYFSYGWWFGRLQADPTDPDILFAHGIGLYRTTDGGDSWNRIGFDTHVDHHAQYIDPDDHDWMIEGNDGGLFISTDGGDSWEKSPDLPITQFYTGEIDFLNPSRLYGGAQDNGTISTQTGAEDDWREIYGGDGFFCLVDPTDSDVIYAESQYGGLSKSTDGGSTWNEARNGIDPYDRRNWNTPVVMDPHDPEILYYGTYRVYRTTDGGLDWEPISNDLTDGESSGNLVFNTVTAIAAAPSDPSTVYAGTDDGNVHVTFDGGGTWIDIGSRLPERWITRIAVDPDDYLKAYVTISGFRWDSPLPHVFLTTDGGTQWSDISGNLPEAPVNDILIDPLATDHLYVATDVGIFSTTDSGAHWQSFNEGFPIVPVTDLVFHPPTRTLLAATYGRSMFSTTLPSPSGIGAEETAGMPKRLALDQNYPNPFNPLTIIRFSTTGEKTLNLRIFDIRGRAVRHLVHGSLPPGDHEVTWNGTDDGGAPLPGGTYLYRIETGAEAITRKMTLIR